MWFSINAAADKVVPHIAGSSEKKNNSEWNNINMNQNIKTLKYIHVLSRTVTLFPSLSTEVTSMTCFFPSLVCLPVETPVTLMLRNHSSKILRTTLIFLYVKNGTATGLLNHATQNILVAVGS